MGEAAEVRRMNFTASGHGYLNQSEYPLTFGLEGVDVPVVDVSVDFANPSDEGLWRVDKYVNPVLGGIDVTTLALPREVRVFRSGAVQIDGKTLRARNGRIPADRNAGRAVGAGHRGRAGGGRRRNLGRARGRDSHRQGSAARRRPPRSRRRRNPRRAGEVRQGHRQRDALGRDRRRRSSWPRRRARCSPTIGASTWRPTSSSGTGTRTA